MALLGLLGDTEGMFCPKTKPQLPYTSTVQCLGSYGQWCSSQTEAQHTLKSFRVNPYPCPGTPTLHGSTPPSLGADRYLCTGLSTSQPGHLFPQLQGSSGPWCVSAP